MYLVIVISIIFLLLLGAINGFKTGFIKSVVSFICAILVFVLSYKLKNPVASLFFKLAPVIDFSGNLGEIYSVLFYEAISFFLVAGLLLSIFKIIIKISGGIEKILNATIILGIPSKLLGMLFGVLKYYVIIFAGLTILNFPFFNLDLTNNSEISNTILNKTPILSGLVKKDISFGDDLIEIKDKYKNDLEQAKYYSLDKMLKYKIITVSSTEYLIGHDKLNIKNADKLVNNYRRK